MTDLEAARLWTTGDVARALSVSRRFVQDRAARGELDADRSTGRLLFAPEAVRRYAARGTRVAAVIQVPASRWGQGL